MTPRVTRTPSSSSATFATQTSRTLSPSSTPALSRYKPLTYFQQIFSNPLKYFRTIIFQLCYILTSSVKIFLLSYKYFQVPGPCLESFLALASSLGVTGFLQDTVAKEAKSPSASSAVREQMFSCSDHDGKRGGRVIPGVRSDCDTEDKENVAPGILSERPLSSNTNTSLGSSKKRKILTRNPPDLSHNKSPVTPHSQSARQPLYMNTSQGQQCPAPSATPTQPRPKHKVGVHITA